MAQLTNGFQFYLEKQSQIGKYSHMNSQKCLILKETNNIKEFYAMKYADYQTKQLIN